MRIIAGELGGRVFDTPGTNNTHPMSERARGALFNILGDINNFSVLDAFSGTGALAFEAASRGAAEVIALELDKTAQKTIESNIRKLDLSDRVQLIKVSANAWSDNNIDLRFDLILCDPPYNKLQVDLLKQLSNHLTPTGIFVVSWPKNQQPPTFETLKEIKQGSYGDARLFFFVRS